MISPEVERVLREGEEALLDPAVRRSAERAGALLSADFVEIGSSGRVFDRAAVLEWMRGEAAVEQRVEGLSARELAARVVLVMYSLVREGRVHSLRSSVWRKEDGAAGRVWRMVFHQGTRVG